MAGDSGPSGFSSSLCRARAGDRAALGELLEAYRNYLGWLARARMESGLYRRVSTSDVVQQTFLEAYRDFRGFRGGSERELMAWIRRILIRNLATIVEQQMLAAKRDVRREVSLEARVEDFEQSAMHMETVLVSAISSPSTQAQRREYASWLASRLAELPEAYREVLVLRNLKGLAFREVARRMTRSQGAVRMLWLRALERLRQLMERDGMA